MASQIQITCDTLDASIYYSIDGSNPSNLYTGPFALDSEATIKAIGKKSGYSDSNMAELSVQKIEGVITLAGRGMYIKGQITKGYNADNITLHIKGSDETNWSTLNSTDMGLDTSTGNFYTTSYFPSGASYTIEYYFTGDNWITSDTNTQETQDPGGGSN